MTFVRPQRPADETAEQSTDMHGAGLWRVEKSAWFYFTSDDGLTCACSLRIQAIAY